MFKAKLTTVLVAGALLGAATVGNGGEAYFERFDGIPLQGKVGEGATLDETGGLEKGALKAVGVKKSLQYFYNTGVQEVKAGEKYAFSFNFKTSAKLVNNDFMVLVAFYAPKGVSNPPSLYFRLPRSVTWSHRQFEFTVPENAVKACILMRLASVPESECVWVDNFHFAPVIDGRAKGIDLESFETAFDEWRLDRHLVFEHFMIQNGKVVIDWRKAKVGEAFFEAVGDKSPMQYPLMISNLRVKPRGNYVFSAWFQAGDSFAFNGNGILIFFYKDAAGKALGQSRYHIRPTKGEWKEFTHTFTAPENCAFVDIGLNMRNQPATSTVRFDHIRFKAGEDKLNTSFEINPDTKKMRVVNTLSGILQHTDVKSAAVTIKPAGPGAARNFNIEIGKDLEVDLAAMPDGEYTLSAQLMLKNGTVISANTQKFGVYNRPDWANEIGVQKDNMPAPAPWRDLKFAAGTVTTWNNTLAFTDQLELRQISGLQDGKKMLRTPFFFNLDGRSVFAAAGQAKWSSGASRVRGRAPLSGKNWTGELELSVDYSGLTRYMLTITAAAPVRFDSGSWGVALDRAEFILRSDGSWTNIGAIDLAADKKYTTTHLYNDLMFGSLDSGLRFFIPNLYPDDRLDYAREYLSANADGAFKVDFLTAPLQLAAGESFKLEFALEPYPVRPAENNWRKLRFRAGKNRNCDLLWQTSTLMKYCGSLMEPSNPAATLDYLKKYGSEYALVYQIPTYILEAIPQWSYFAAKWRAQPARAYDMGSFGPLPKGDFRERSWQDLYVKNMAETLKTIPWAGVYYDCFTGDLLSEKGKKYMPIFELRDFQERVYNTQRLSNPKSLTIVHCNMVGSLMSFSNVFLTGEQHRGSFATAKYYQQFTTLDRFRYETSANIGPDGMLLPQYRLKEDVENPELAAHVMGMATLHNLMIYPNFIRSDIELRIRDRQYAFGMGDAEFFGYWKKNPDGLATDHEAVKISYWKNPRGIFATVFNNSAKPVEFKLKRASGKPSGEFYEPVGDTVTKITPDTVLKLEAYRPGYITCQP